LAPDASVGGACAISLNAGAKIAAPSTGAQGTITITTAAGCTWKASSPQPWVTVTAGSASGNGAVDYAIAPNPGPARQTAITVADRPITVTQAAGPTPAPATAPAMSATSLNFGAQIIGATSGAQSVTLTNTGGALNLAFVATGGSNGRDFTETNSCGSTMAAGAACQVSVTFRPSAAGVRTASLVISGNFSGGPRTVALSGTGVATGPVPTIQAVVDAWTYTRGVAPGLWVTIAGTNLGGPPQLWDLTGVQQLPTSLGGVTVTFNDTLAPLAYVRATQINALVPASIAPGPVQIVVQVNGVHSAPFPATASMTQPSVYSLPDAGGASFFVTAALQGSATLVGNSAVDPRVARAAYPGDVLDLYMIGLGATVDPSKFVTDKLFSGAFPVNAKVTATVGGAPAPVSFAGLISPGLYLVRITVPTGLPAGPQPIEISAGESRTQSLVLTVGTPP
ncbi:MAG TPA: choice-of-anchor D domain-containing protein, partial [Bryobacteraceae bacterium]